MNEQRKSSLFSKIRTFGKFAGKMQGISADIAQKKQMEEEEKNLLNTDIEQGIALEKFLSTIQRKIKTEADTKMILQNIQEYESINKLFGKDTEIQAKLMLCKGMTLEVFEKGQPIVKEGEASNNKFYVIAKGSVAIVKAIDTNVFQVVAPKKEEPPQDDDIEDLPENRNKKKSTIKKNSVQGRGSVRGSKLIQFDQKEVERNLWEKEVEKYGKEVNQLYVGQGFGEAAIMEADPKRAKRGATILAREDQTSLIIIVKRDFQKFKDSFSSQGKEKAQILTQLIPQLKVINSTQTKNDLIFYFQEEGGLRGKALTIEDKTGDKIYVLKEGQVQIEKNYLNTKNIYFKDVQKLKIASVGDCSFLGEEILLGGDEQRYNYTVTVSSIQARYYTIKKAILQTKFPNIIKDILSEYRLKEINRTKTVEYILSKDQQPSNMISVDETLHQFNKLKNDELFSKMKNTMVESHNKKVFKDVVAKEKEQTPENLAQLRQDLMRQIEEKPKQQTYSIDLNHTTTNDSNYAPFQSQANKLKRPLTSSSHVGHAHFPEKSNKAEISQVVSMNVDRHQSVTNLHQQPNNSNFFNSNNQYHNGNGDLQIKPHTGFSPSRKNNTNITSQQSDPIYSKLYQHQHDLENDFMLAISEKLKLMAKVPSQDSPQLDLGYLEAFKKKQQQKKMITAKYKEKWEAQQNINRQDMIQKTIEMIKIKFMKGEQINNMIMMENLQQPSQSQPQSQQKLYSNQSNPTDLQNSKFNEFAEFNNQQSSQQTNQGGNLKQNNQYHDALKSPITQKHEKILQKQQSLLKQNSSGVPISPRWKVIMNHQGLTSVNSNSKDSNHFQCMSVQSFKAQQQVNLQPPSHDRKSLSMANPSLSQHSNLPYLINENKEISGQPPSLFFHSKANTQIDNSSCFNFGDQSVAENIAPIQIFRINSSPLRATHSQGRNFSGHDYSIIEPAGTAFQANPFLPLAEKSPLSIINSNLKEINQLGQRSLDLISLSQQKRNISSVSNINSARPISSGRTGLLRSKTSNSLIKKSIERSKLKTGLAFPKEGNGQQRNQN